MFDFAKTFSDELTSIHEGGRDYVLIADELQEDIGRAFRDALIDGKLDIPLAASDHGMPLSRAAYALKRSKFDNPNLVDLLTWATRTHLFDVFSMAIRLRRETPEITLEDFIAKVNAYAENQLTEGTFDAPLHPDTDLVASAWDGLRYRLRFRKWRAEIYRETRPVVLAPAVHRAITRPNIPKTIEVEMKLPSGKLIIGSSLPCPALEDRFLEMRRAAQGLSGEIDVTNKILDDYQILALPVHKRALRVLSWEGLTSIIAEDNPDKTFHYEKARLLLDYRFLTIADEEILQRNIRALPQGADTDLTASLSASHTRIEVEPGFYRIMLPANYSHQLSARDQGKSVIVALDKIPDR